MMFDGLFVGYEDDPYGESIMDTMLARVTTFAILYPQTLEDGTVAEDVEQLGDWADENFDEWEIREIV